MIMHGIASGTMVSCGDDNTAARAMPPIRPGAPN